MRTLIRVGVTVMVIALAVGIRSCLLHNRQDASKEGALSEPAPVPQPAVVKVVSIRDFVSATYAEGVPYDQAASFGAGAVSELLTFLSDPSMVDARSNIVITLGMIGGATAESELKKLIEQGNGKLAPEEFSVRLDALMALGYAAKLAPTVVTLDYLMSGLQPAMWASKVSWQRPDGGNPFPRLRERTVIALGLCGNPRAKIALQDLLTSGGAGGGGGRGGGGGGSVQLTPNDRAVIAEAIRANDYLATHSLRQYFKDYR